MSNNLFIHVPHASLRLPQDFWSDIVIDQKIIKQNLKFMADYKVDELVRDINCHKVIANYSRLYCDVEQFREDIDEPMARFIAIAMIWCKRYLVGREIFPMFVLGTIKSGLVNDLL